MGLLMHLSVDKNQAGKRNGCWLKQPGAYLRDSSEYAWGSVSRCLLVGVNFFCKPALSTECSFPDMKSGPGAKPRSPSHGRVCPLASQLLAEPQAGRCLEQKSGWLLGNIAAPSPCPTSLSSIRLVIVYLVRNPAAPSFFPATKMRIVIDWLLER